MISRNPLRKELIEVQEFESFDTFLYFEERLSHVLENYLYQSPPLHLLSFEEKQMIFALLWYVRSPQSATENSVSDSDLKKLDKNYQQIVRTFRVSYEGKAIALIDYNILAAFYHVLYHGIKNRKRAGDLKEAFAIPILEGVSMIKSIPNMYTACFSMMIGRLNDICNRFYSFEMLRNDRQGNLSMTLTPVISIYRARQVSMLIHRNFRSVYKVPDPHFYSGISWLTIPIAKLSSHYSGNKSELNLYIQSHALSQMQKCLDIFDPLELNDVLNFNLRNIESIENYKGNLLIPIYVCRIKVGYWVLDVIDENIVAKSFLFILNSNTPEGEKLLEKYNYLKSDVTHCKSSRLSYLLKVEDEVSLSLYSKGGFEDVFQLKDYKLIIDAMQEANYKEFLSYIKQGEEAELSVAIVDQDDLTLQDYSLGRLLGLLVLNTTGLIVAQIIKMFYLLSQKVKSLGKQNAKLKRDHKKQTSIDLSNAKLIMRNEFEVRHSESKNFEEQVS